MTDFGTWVSEKAAAESKYISTKLYGGMMPVGETMLSDLATLAAQLYDAASPFEALQDKATDPRVGLTQPVTVAEAEALNAALDACKEFMDRYD